MKRIAALLLALALLLMPVAACGETMISTATLTDLSVAYIENGKARTAHLNGLCLTLSMGCTEGVPTLQVNLETGSGQMVDGVFAVVGDRLLASFGGISGTYYVDLESICDEPGTGARLARNLASGLALSGPHLDALLQALSTVDEKGERMLRFDLPGDIYTAIADSVMKIADGIDFLSGQKVQAAKEKLVEGPVSLIVRYSPKDEEIQIDMLQGDDGLRLNADIELTVQPMGLVNISSDELMYDLTNMGFGRLMEMRGEIAIIALKFVKFSGGSGLSRILG